MLRRILVALALLVAAVPALLGQSHPPNWNWLTAEQQQVWTASCQPPSPAMAAMCAAIVALPGGSTPAGRSKGAQPHPANWNWLTAEQQQVWTANCQPPSSAMAAMCAAVAALPGGSFTSDDRAKSTEVQQAPRAELLHKIGSGTAFVVGQNLIATNYHVIDGGTAWKVRFPPEQHEWPLEVVAADKANDLVVMRLMGAAPSLKALSLVPARVARLGEDVYSIGFPLTGLLSDGHKVSTGVVSGLSGMDDDPRLFQLTVPTQPGNSGGPIFNSKGEVVGILASTLSVEYLYKATRAIPQNVNFAIKSDYLLLLLAQPDTGTAASRNNVSGLARVDQIAAAQGSIGLLSTLAAEPRTSKSDGPRNIEASKAPEVPALEVSYRHPTGPSLLIKQRGVAATITFYRADSSVFGNGSVSWRPDVGGFVGIAEIPYVCGPIDTRVTTVRGELQLFLEGAGTLLMKMQTPTRINCTQNRVDFTWGEDRWYP